MNKEKRGNCSSDPGILRKKTDPESELLIFGYASTLFRDDQKALEMDQGKHLIPWNGMESLKIDRYDARGHLMELSQFESSSHDYVPTLEEREFEQMCDKERYRALEQNEEEHLMYQEEEFKRLKHSSSNKEYGQVSYQYTEDNQAPSTRTTNAELESQPEDLEPYVPSPLLDIPQHLVLPTTKKENQIIEKTASYIALHGPQVEIIVKTRQANNEKLSFMHAGNPLNPFYNFILDRIKNGRYRPGADQQTHVEGDVTEDYLHPTLSSSVPVESAPSIPNIAYKPSGDSSYDLLVKNIKNAQQNLVATSSAPPSRGVPSTNHMKNGQKPPKPPRSKILATVTNVSSSEPPPHIKEIIAKLINFAQTMNLHPSDLANNLLMKKSKNVEFLMPDHPYHSYYKEQLASLIKDKEVEVPEQTDESSLCGPETLDTQTVSSGQTEPMVVEEEENDQSESSASWFVQLTSQEISEENGTPSQSTVACSEQSVVPSEYDVPNQPTARPVPVCFSIKKPKDEKLEIPSALPVEETSEEEDGGDGKKQETVPKVDSPKIPNPKVPYPTVKSKAQVYNEGEDIADKIDEKAKPREGRKRDKKSKSSHSDVNGINEPVSSSTSYRRIKKKAYLKSKPKRSEEGDSKTPTSPVGGSREKKRKRESLSSKVSSSSKISSTKVSSTTPAESPAKETSPLLDLSLSPKPNREVDKLKKEERKKRAKVLVDMLKNGTANLEDENNQGVGSGSSTPSFLPMPPSSFTTFLPQGPIVKSSEEKKHLRKDREEELRNKVKESLQKLASTIGVLPLFQCSESSENALPLDKDALKIAKSISENNKPLDRFKIPKSQSSDEDSTNENQEGSSPLFRPSTSFGLRRSTSSENRTAVWLRAVARTRLKPKTSKTRSRSSDESSSSSRSSSSDSDESSSSDSSSSSKNKRRHKKSSSRKRSKRSKKYKKRSKKSKKSSKKSSRHRKRRVSSHSSVSSSDSS